MHRHETVYMHRLSVRARPTQRQRCAVRLTDPCALGPVCVRRWALTGKEVASVTTP